VRDFGAVKVEQEVPNEFLLVLDDGKVKEEVKQETKVEFNDLLNGDVKPPLPLRRAKGAYYKNIERKMFLKKKRAMVRIISP
jgi:RNA polymerase II-associated factor 1